MHFNHFIKLHDLKSIDKESLLLRVTRGAAVLCANNHTSIDLINVFLLSNKALKPDNFGLILGQVKNDSSYTDTPQPHLFDAMDPVERLHILEPKDKAIPLVKIFFALAAKTPCLKVTRHPPTSTYNAVIYDIWCAGISPEIFGPINPVYAHVWEALLQASYGWQDLYKTDTQLAQSLRRSMNPGAASDDSHWSCWVAPDE
jgi:hypothetical protein